MQYSSQNIFYPFHQNRNLLYLTGYPAPDAIAVLHCKGGYFNPRLIIFSKQDDPFTLQWTGPTISHEQCKQEYGAELTYPLAEFTGYIQGCIDDQVDIYADLEGPSRDCFTSEQRAVLGKRAHSLTEHMHRLRVVKSPAEHSIMRQAALIGADALTNTFGYMTSQTVREEALLAARMEWECKQRNATLAYVPVIAGGPRSLVLHYTHNNGRLRDGEMLLVDAGAQFEGYCSDISRTVAVGGDGNGKSPEQEIIYNAVLHVQRACIDLLDVSMKEKRSISLDDLHLYSARLFTDILKGLKIPVKLLDTLYPHSIGHYIGLDLHDCPTVSTRDPLVPGMTLTVEPGLYIPEHPAINKKLHNIGVRIEDDVLIDSRGMPCHDQWGCKVERSRQPWKWTVLCRHSTWTGSNSCPSEKTMR